VHGIVLKDIYFFDLLFHRGQVMPVNYLPLYGTYHPKTMKKIVFLPLFFLFAAITYGQFDK